MNEVLRHLQEDAYINNAPVAYIRNNEITNIYISTAEDIDTNIYSGIISNYSNLIDLHNKMLDLDNKSDSIYDLDELISIWLNDILVNVYKSTITIDSFMLDFLELVTIVETNNLVDVKNAIQHLDNKLINIQKLYNEYESCSVHKLCSVTTNNIYRLEIPTPKLYMYVRSLSIKAMILNAIKYNNGEVLSDSSLVTELDKVFNIDSSIDYITVYINTFFKYNDMYTIYKQRCNNCNIYTIHKHSSI